MRLHRDLSLEERELNGQKGFEPLTAPRVEDTLLLLKYSWTHSSLQKGQDVGQRVTFRVLGAAIAV